MELFLGFITGILFGFLLQKGRVLRYEVQVGFLRFTDMTLITFMFSAVMIGMIGITLFRDLGVIVFKVKSLSLGAQIIGALLFGIGWAIYGYCPGTAIGAVGEGRLHAVWGIIGMLCGAAFFAEVYPLLNSTIIQWGQFGALRLPDLLPINHWIVIVVFVIGIVTFFVNLEKRKL